MNLIQFQNYCLFFGFNSKIMEFRNKSEDPKIEKNRCILEKLYQHTFKYE